MIRPKRVWAVGAFVSVLASFLAAALVFATTTSVLVDVLVCAMVLGATVGSVQQSAVGVRMDHDYVEVQGPFHRTRVPISRWAGVHLGRVLTIVTVEGWQFDTFLVGEGSGWRKSPTRAAEFALGQLERYSAPRKLTEEEVEVLRTGSRAGADNWPTSRYRELRFAPTALQWAIYGAATVVLATLWILVP